jgi:hypothetical protein
MLWTLLHDEGDEALLFRKDDFVSSASSRALVSLAQCKDDRLRALSELLSRFWMSDVCNIPELDTKATPVPNTQQSSVTRLNGSRATAKNDLTEALADWSASMTVTAPESVDQANDSSWALAYMPPVKPLPFAPTHRAIRYFSAVALLALVAITILGGMAVLPAIVAVIGDAVLIAFVFTVSGLSFTKTAESRDKRASLRLYKQRQAEVSTAERATSKAEKDRRAVDQHERQALEKIGQRANDAHAAEQRELQAAEARVAMLLSKVTTQTQGLQSAESAEKGNALRALQDQHLTAQLIRASIRSATIYGIGDAVRNELIANGITTAADFTGISYGTGTEVFINLRNGLRVHPYGVGEVKAVALETWRQEVEARARRTQPTSLSPAQVQAIRLKYAQQRQSLAQEEHRARAESANQQHQICERWATTYAALGGELAGTRDRFLQERAQADARLREARKEARDLTWQLVKAEQELGAYREVTYRRYCTCVARG